MKINKEIIILGGGMVGLSVAHQLIERKLSKNITIIDKENSLGMHTSGRNSGVLHAGIYYAPNSLKAKVSVEGANRLKEWIKERNLSINNCGKIIVPTRKSQDEQLELLKERGINNGAKVEFINEKEIKEKIPFARTATKRGLWSPNTSVVNPKEVLLALQNDLIHKNVEFILGEKIKNIDPNGCEIRLTNDITIQYKYLFNCTGLNSDRIAHYFSIGKNYTLLPFKGLYWKLKSSSQIKIKTNLYPVPDLSVPFLGVHFTPSGSNFKNISIGPTAVPAWGRENYNGLEKVEPIMAFKNLSILAKQYLLNKEGFRGYVHKQSLQSLTPIFLKSAQELIPEIKLTDIEESEKVGIRAQLFNLKDMKLEDDFICVNTKESCHVLNAISPAFTASFALGDLIINKSSLLK